MDPSWIPYIVLFIVVDALAVALVVFLWRRNEQMHQAREAMSEAKGWRYSRPAGKVNYQIEGTSPTENKWTLQATRARSSGNSSSTAKGQLIWTAELPAPPSGAVLLGPKLPQVAQINFGGMIAQFLLKWIFGEDASEFSNLREVTIGDPSIEDRWMVLATDEALAKEFVSGPTLLALQDMTDDTPVVLYWKKGLQLRVMETVTQPDRIRRLVEFGELLLTTT